MQGSLEVEIEFIVTDQEAKPERSPQVGIAISTMPAGVVHAIAYGPESSRTSILERQPCKAHS